jgi:Ca-activated chloride channel family protein
MSDFHFLRPLWFLAVLPAAVIVWRLWRTSHDRQSWREIISDELLPHLLVGKSQSHRFGPLLLLAIGWSIAILALTGPAWRKEPAPFSDDVAALVIVLKITPSMLTEDVQPNRLARSVQKIRDLLKERPGAKTALVAYAGSAHRVLPLTSDAEVINSFAAELSPNIFPEEGDVAGQALVMANDILTRSNERGWLLWIADDISPEQQVNLKQVSSTLAPMSILVPEATGEEFERMKSAAKTSGAKLVVLTPDETDIQQLMKRTVFSDVPTTSGGDRWQDAGYFLVPVLLLMVLFWFRRGWVIRGAVWGGA